MTREIKFRAYDSTTGKMSEPFDVKESWGDYLIDFEDYSTDGALDSIIWEQFTGLLDRNGKEIYEGDIIKARWYRAKNARFDTKGEIRYNDGWFYIHDDPDGQDRLGVPIHNCYSVEVIGNIHENPDLLEKGEENE